MSHTLKVNTATLRRTGPLSSAAGTSQDLQRMPETLDGTNPRHYVFPVHSYL